MVVKPAREIYQPYYTTSKSLVNYMVENLAVTRGMRVFEPCAGNGVFIDALIEKISDITVEAFELDTQAVATLNKKYANDKRIFIKHCDTLTDDMLTLYANSGGYFERIIANPPYGGWQDYDKRKDLKKLYPQMYVKETYTLFLYRCIQLLKENGLLVFIVPDTFLNLHSHTALRKFMLTNTKIKEIALFPSFFFPNINFGYANLSIITLEKSYKLEECLANQVRVLTGFRQVEELEKAKDHNLKVHTLKQEHIFNTSNHAFIVSDSPVLERLSCRDKKIGDIADCVTGLYSGNDRKFLRPISSQAKNGQHYTALTKELICPDYSTRNTILNGIADSASFIPIVKGGAVKYFKPDLWYIDWSTEAVKAYKTDKKARFQNSRYYFTCGIGIPMVSSSHVTAALMENKLFDQSIVGVFPHNPEWIYYLLAFFNSPTCTKLLRAINPSANNSANYIKKVPFIFPEEPILHTINLAVCDILAALKEGNQFKAEDESYINQLIKDVYGC
jgi:adenine-specific DNA-methyltransferase